jgi:malonyl CoA-acyl carrier protein transacylase
LQPGKHLLTFGFVGRVHFAFRQAPEADPAEVRDWLGELREQIVAGVENAEEQVADADTSEPAAVKQAALTLAALVATRDAATQAMAGQ